MALAQRILAQVPLIDGHNDFPYMIRGWFLNQLHNSEPEFNIQDMPVGQTDLTRLGRGRVGGQFWSVFIPWFDICPALFFPLRALFPYLLHEREDQG